MLTEQRWKLSPKTDANDSLTSVMKQNCFEINQN